ncbi:MAG: hypothetical protein J07HQW2_00244 [Haloquadratum walsbyi J07HQW2]|jgi:hypothetical protein|uniref:Uncharacterized protein n=1 Tax=Haloquadratum walsbyi J07HQW2 TaxID=1238425 RepID=U1NAF8_9EURY|nr:MAG: hypothetical protein J07HQW2_00244 [Haloquadratum walsbyi J07HQW2]
MFKRKLESFPRVAETINREGYQELIEFNRLKTTESDYHYKYLWEENNNCECED